MLVYDELLASCLAPSQPHRALKVTPETQPVVVGEESALQQGILKQVCNPASISPRKFAHAIPSVFRVVLFLGLTRMGGRATSIAFHTIVKASEVSAVPAHPSLGVRSDGGSTSASTALKITLVKDSAISKLLVGCEGRLGSLEKIQ